MALRFEITGIEHPFKLCLRCSDALGWISVVVEPGHPRTRELFVCHEHLASVLHELGESIIRQLEEAKRAKEDEC